MENPEGNQLTEVQLEMVVKCLCLLYVDIVLHVAVCLSLDSSLCECHDWDTDYDVWVFTRRSSWLLMLNMKKL